MKVNLGVTLTDEERAVFNEALGEPKLASRKQVTAFLEDCLKGALAAAPKVVKAPTPVKISSGFSLMSDNRDPALDGKSMGYIIGWNKVKYREQLAKNKV